MKLATKEALGPRLAAAAVAGGLLAACRDSPSASVPASVALPPTTKGRIGMSTLELAQDRFQIEELRYCFGRALDDRDWALFESLFTEHVDADYAAFGVPAARMPRSSVVDLMKHSFRRDEMKSQQIYTNFEIALDGDEARATSYLVGRHHIPGFSGGEDFTLRARYHDNVVRTSSGWKLAGVRLEVIFMEGNIAIVS